jgi:hypothetical protein
MAETFKTNTSPPIPRPVEPIDEVEAEIPEPMSELDVTDFLEIESNVTLTPEEACEKRVIIRKLHSYYLTFPKECMLRKDAIMDSVEINDLGQLNMLLSDVEHMISSGRSIGSGKNIFLAGTSVVEILSRKTPLKLQGLTAVCRESPELDSVIQELTIKYQNEVVLGPEQRLGLIMVGLCSQIHAHNKAHSEKDENEIKQINNEEKEKDERRQKIINDLDEDA